MMMNYRTQKVKIEVLPLSKDLSNWKSWKEAVQRYLRKHNALHLVHEAYNREMEVAALERLQPGDNESQMHTIIKAQRSKARTPEDFEQVTPIRETEASSSSSSSDTESKKGDASENAQPERTIAT